MRNLKAALFGLLWAFGATALGALIYWVTLKWGREPFTAGDLLFVALIAVSGWIAYLLPGLALGVSSRFFLDRFGAAGGTLLGAALAVAVGALVGFLSSRDAPHVMMPRAIVSVAAAWGITALIVLPCAYFLFLKRPVHEGDRNRALADG